MQSTTSTSRTPTHGGAVAGDLLALRDSWVLSLEAENKSARTIVIYSDAVRFLDEYLAETGMPRRVAAITREHLETYIASVLRTRKAATASGRYRPLRRFFDWCVEEGEIPDTPMRNMRPPAIPEETVPVFTLDEIRRLFDSAKGTSFFDRRDLALMMLLADSGMRRAECAALRVGDVDLREKLVNVVGKGRRPRTIGFGAKTARALDRYLRVRRQHRDADAAPLWLGQKGPLGADGLRQLLERRGEIAGVEGVHAHRFRHTFSHEWLANDGAEGDLMMINGWRSRQMLNRYGASAASARAVDAQRRNSLVDRMR